MTFERATLADDRYGLICPDCGMPKTKRDAFQHSLTLERGEDGWSRIANGA